MSNSSSFDQNFFWSARSEAYQDAFLLWLFRNYDSKGELGEFSAFFVDKLLNCNGSQIKSKKILSVDSQVHDSDISLLIDTSEGNYLIIIEDKAGSSVHKSARNQGSQYYKTQLEKYYKEFAKDKKYEELIDNSKVRLIYYKNEILNRTEEERIEAWTEDKQVKDSWQKYDIVRISELFKNYLSKAKKTSFDNVILNEYYQNLDLWKSEYDGIFSRNFNIDLQNYKNRAMWNKQSWLWEAVFYRLADSVLGKKPTQGYNVGKYNGKYIEFGIHAKNEKTVMIVSAGSFCNGEHSIVIQLRNKKYGDNVPWNNNEERELDLEKVKNILRKNASAIDATFIPAKKTNRKGYDNNKAGEFRFKMQELNYLQLEENVKTVKKFFDEKIDV